MATFNEFQRELQKRNISSENAYMFTLIYERLIHMGKEVEDASKLVFAFAQTMEQFVALHEDTQGKLRQLMKHNMTEGVDIKSEPNN